jgi:ATP-binding cassette subfamily B protein
MLSQSDTLRRALRLLSEGSGRTAVLSVIILIVRALLPLVVVLLLGHYVDLLTGEGAAKVAAEKEALFNVLLWLTVAIALALLFDDLLAYAGNYVTKKHAYLTEGHISSLIHAHSGRLGLRFFEDPLFHDRLERAARDISWRPAALTADFITLLRGVISFAAMAYLLRNFGLIALAILALVFIPLLLVKVRNSQRLYETRKRVTADVRQASYFSWLLTGEKPAREVKLFDTAGYFERLFRKYFIASREPELQTVRRNIIPESLASLLKVAAFAGVVVYATAKYLGGAITAGELAVYLVAFRQATVYLRDVVTGYAGLAENRIFLQDLFIFLDLEPGMAGEDTAPEPDSFAELAAGNITFTYPGASRPALQDVSLRITRGEKVAIVGPNGSGKTTLVKLLCRLYDPDEGQITVNGNYASSIAPASYRRLFSVVFQNFMLYYLSAGDNIRLGGDDAGSDDAAVQRAAAATGLSELLESLPEGYDTQLGHHTDGSRELSWGEWQKIAIARALCRKAPVLILDEPSSSLDADSEYEIFSDLDRITEGRTCIFISHRLSNVRAADRIIMLDGGRVAETGTHDELMAAGGRYHDMFTRQKAMYR